MKTSLLFTVLVTLLVSCSSKHQIEKALHSGNYDQAIEDALRKLENNKTKDRKQDFVVMLEDAYYKAVARDLKTIEHLKKDGNSENFKAIYESYLDLDARQEAIKPILPLQVAGKVVNLKFNNYSNDIIIARNTLANYMYDKGLALLESENKSTIRNAYDVFSYIERIYPNYEQTRELLKEAHERGTDFVIVSIENHTNQIIPQQLENDLLNFDTNGLNKFWTVYHTNADYNIDYDFAMKLQLERINISADELHERQLLKEKRIVDGWKYQLDASGNVLKDSLGNDIKIDNIINVRARYSEFTQLKSANIIADVVTIDLKQQRTLNAFPIDSQLIFENQFATIRGDKRALERNEIALLNRRQEFFPSDLQILSDLGEMLKAKLKDRLAYSD